MGEPWVSKRTSQGGMAPAAPEPTLTGNVYRIPSKKAARSPSSVPNKVFGWFAVRLDRPLLSLAGAACHVVPGLYGGLRESV